jgi:hypothetical protein
LAHCLCYLHHMICNHPIYTSILLLVYSFLHVTDTNPIIPIRVTFHNFCSKCTWTYSTLTTAFQQLILFLKIVPTVSPCICLALLSICHSISCRIDIPVSLQLNLNYNHRACQYIFPTNSAT